MKSWFLLFPFLIATSAQADVILAPGESIRLAGQLVRCESAAPQCRSDWECGTNEQCSAGRCVPRAASVFSSEARCVPVNADYAILQNTLTLITEMRDGTQQKTNLGVYELQSDCRKVVPRITKFSGTDPVRSRICVPIDPRYGILKNTLVQVTQLPEGPVNLTSIGDFEYRSACEAELN